MTEIKINSVNNVNDIKPLDSAGAAPREFSPREGQVYSAKVKGFSAGAAIVAINERYLLSLSDISLKIGDRVSLKLLKRETDGKLVFKLVDSEGDSTFTAKERSAADILKSVGANVKNPQSANILESYLKFGFKLDARSIDRAASSLARIISGGTGLTPAAGDARLLADGAALLTKSNIAVTQNSLKLAVALIENLRSQSVNYNRLFSSPYQLLASGLAGIADGLEQKNKKASAAAKRIAAVLDAPQPGETAVVKLAAGELFRFSPGNKAETPYGVKENLLKDLFTLAGELEKISGEAGSEAAATGVDYGRARENVAALIENRALIELYSAMAGSELFKMPFGYEGEGHEALCSVERENGRVTALDMYLTLSKLGDVRVNVKKKDAAAGFYIFVKSAAIKDYINEKYLENKEFMDSALGGHYYFTVVVGKTIDFLPPVFKNIYNQDQPAEFDMSV